MHLQNTQTVYKIILCNVITTLHNANTTTLHNTKDLNSVSAKSNLYIYILIFNEPVQTHKRFNMVHGN